MYFLSLEERKYQRKKSRPLAFFASKVVKAIRNRRVRRRATGLNRLAKSDTAGDLFLFFSLISRQHIKFSDW